MKPTLRVCHIITRLCVGGAQENTLLTVRGLRRLGYEVCLVYGRADKGEGSLESWVRQYRLPAFYLDTLVRQPHPFYDFLALCGLYQFLRRRSFDIVHTHTSKAGVLGRMAAKLCRVPLVIHTPHGHVFHSYFSPVETKVYLTLEQVMAKLSDALIALTETERQEHYDLGIARHTPFFVIHSGVSPPPLKPFDKLRQGVREELRIPTDAPVVGTVARLVPIKGIRYLLMAFRLFQRHCENARLVLVGDGPERKPLEKFSQQLGMRSSVHFAGFQEDVWRFLASFDVFVLPSLNEGMGKVLIQAAFMQVPVVATAVGGVKDLVEEGVTGWLVPPKDEKALAQRLIAIFGDISHARAVAQEACRQLTRRYSEEAMVRQIDRLYRFLWAEKVEESKFSVLSCGRRGRGRC